MKWENLTGIIRNKVKAKRLKYNNPNPPISVSCSQLGRSISLSKGHPCAKAVIPISVMFLQRERLILLMRGQLFARADIPVSVI